MCGIAGFFGRGDEKILEQMADSIRYRGPDDKGYFYDGRVGLAQRRLAIIDLSPTGHQPMCNNDKTVWIVFNGEIYNFQEIKKDLLRGHKFHGSSDTEVIIHLYEKLGVEAFKKIQGMFALAIYDRREQKLILARDRFGKKPLYWSQLDSSFIFASEPKAILKHPGQKPELDLSSLQSYLYFEHIPTPKSIYKNINKLEPGTFLEFRNNKIKKEKFWDIGFGNSDKISFADAKTELDKRLDRSVRMRLVSDVPLGIFLSGGIDSSTIAYYAQKNSTEKIKTFSIGFKEDSFDESGYARAVSKHLQTEHYEKIMSAGKALDLIPEITAKLDEPMADASILPTYLLSAFTREKVTVALGGDGGDELFAGYGTFQAHKFAEIYEKIPAWLHDKIIARLVNMLPTGHKYFSLDFKAKKFINGFSGPKKYRDQRWLGSFLPADIKPLLSGDANKSLAEEKGPEKIIDNYLLNAPEDYWSRLTYLYMRLYMMELVLVKVDRASMYNSLEVRAPFLDTDVVDLVASLPIGYKLKKYRVKHILKELMADRLPSDIINRRKKGFGIPLGKWFRGPLKPYLTELFNEKKITNQNILNHQVISGLLNEHFAGKVDNRKPIWTLLIFQTWYDIWIK